MITVCRPKTKTTRYQIKSNEALSMRYLKGAPILMDHEIL